MTTISEPDCPTLAVVIPSYNYARFISDAIESVLSQEPPVDELVVVDDGSTDNSVEIIRSYADRLQLLVLENGGHARACLAGMELCSSDYVYFLDSDDYIAPGFVAALRPAMAGGPVKLQFQLETVTVENESVGSFYPSYPASYDSRAMRIDNQQIGFYQCPPTSGNVFHRETLQSFQLARFDKIPGIDGPGPLVMPYRGEVVTLRTRLAFYRVHGKGAGQSKHYHPSPASLDNEIAAFRDTWDAALQVLGVEEAPFGQRDPLYVLERKAMIAALENRLWLGGPVCTFLRRLWGTRLAPGRKLLMSAWALALLLPLARLRRSLVDQRRGPHERSALLRAIVLGVLHPRRLFARRVGSG